MQITATEFKLNLGKYLDLVEMEDIWITRNGKMIARMLESFDSIPINEKSRTP